MSGRRAMTLVELLVALALVGMMSALAALMWTQLARVEGATEAAAAALRPQRVVMMLDRQWSARTPAEEASEREGEDAPVAGRVEARRDELRFRTLRPALDPTWPTAEAVYRVRREGSLASLVYAEVAVGPAGERLAAGNGAGEEIALLEGARSLEWRYRVRRPAADESEPDRVEWTTDPEALTLADVEVIAVELWAELASGEGVAWVGLVEPLR